MALSGLALVRGLHCCFGFKTHFSQQFEACKFSVLQEVEGVEWNTGMCSKSLLFTQKQTGPKLNDAQLPPKEQQLQNKEISKQYIIPHSRRFGAYLILVHETWGWHH